jgi:hypothetical protein
MGNAIDGYEDAANLTCPYTGVVMTVVRNEALGAWTCAGGFDPSKSFLTKGILETALRTRKGVPNAVSILRCPYTGAGLQIVESRGGFRVGGRYYTPTTSYEKKQELFFEVSTRNGREPKFPRATVVKAGEVVEQHSDPTEGVGEGGEDTVQLAKEILDL